jgi:hypothetical protein
MIDEHLVLFGSQTSKDGTHFSVLIVDVYVTSANLDYRYTL